MSWRFTAILHKLDHTRKILLFYNLISPLMSLLYTNHDNKNPWLNFGYTSADFVHGIREYKRQTCSLLRNDIFWHAHVRRHNTIFVSLCRCYTDFTNILLINEKGQIWQLRDTFKEYFVWTSNLFRQYDSREHFWRISLVVPLLSKLDDRLGRRIPPKFQLPKVEVPYEMEGSDIY